MGDKLNKADVMNSLEELEDLLSKAQITQGGNSERKEWAGSSWEDEGIPSHTPNGTDYVPPKKVTRKGMDQMPLDEIERYLEMRKSGAPNPIAAENEILQTVPGVEKAICPKCDGTQRDVLTKSNCTKCNGFGFVWMVPTQESASMIKSIEAKWNVSKAVQPPHGKNTGGGKEGADITPKDGNAGGPEEKPETVNSTPNPSSDTVKKALAKAKKAFNDEMGHGEPDGDEEVPLPKDKPGMNDGGEDKEKEDEELAQLLSGEGKGKGKGKCATKKSIDDETLGRTINTMMKALNYFANRMDNLSSSLQDIQQVQSDQADLVNGMAKSFIDVQKSMSGNTTPRPAHAPKAVTNNVQVLQKGFVDSAPDSLNAGTGPKYDFTTLKKGAVKMAIHGKMDKRISLRMDTGEVPEDKIIKSIESYIDENGID